MFPVIRSMFVISSKLYIWFDACLSVNKNQAKLIKFLKNVFSYEENRIPYL